MPCLSWHFYFGILSWILILAFLSCTPQFYRGVAFYKREKIMPTELNAQTFGQYMDEVDYDYSDESYDRAISHALRASGAVKVAVGYTYIPENNSNAYDGGDYHQGWREYVLPVSGEKIFVEAVHMHSYYEFFRLLDEQPSEFIEREEI